MGPTAQIGGPSPDQPHDEDAPPRVLTMSAARIILVAAIVMHVFMFFSLFFSYLNPLFDNSEFQPQGVDFFAIYQSATLLLHGHSIYSWTPPDSVPYATPYRYLPFIACSVAVAFNAIPAWPAYWLWVSLIEVMLLANAWLTVHLAPDRRWGLVAAAMWFAFTPLYLELYMGQWSFLMATLMLWTAAGLVRGSPARAGVPWAMSVLAKSNSALLGPIFLRLRSWRVLVITGAAVVVLNLPYFAARPEDIRSFWNINFGQYTNSLPQPLATFARLAPVTSADLGGTSLARTTWLAFDPGAPDMPQWVSRGIVIVVVAITLAATFLPRRLDVLAAFGGWSSTYFLVYSAWEHHYVMLLPAVALLVALRPQYRALALVVFAFVAVPTPYFLFQHLYGDPAASSLRSPQLFWPAWAGILDHTTKVVPVFALWSTLCWTQLAPAWRERISSRHFAPGRGEVASG